MRKGKFNSLRSDQPYKSPRFDFYSGLTRLSKRVLLPRAEKPIQLRSISRTRNQEEQSSKKNNNNDKNSIIIKKV